MTWSTFAKNLRNLALRLRPYPMDREVEVLKVHDGDTITVAERDSAGLLGMPYKVRLCGIDAPELAQKPWGSEARLALMGSLGWDGTGPTSKVTLVMDRRQKDKYGRTLAWVRAGGVLVNISMVARGFAVAYLLAPNKRFADQVQTAEAWARRAQLNVWEPFVPPFVMPWVWRKDHPFHARFVGPWRG